MGWDILWQVLAVLLVLVGIVGTVFPALPGTVLVLGGLVLSAWAEDFVYVGALTIAILCGLTVISYLVDFAATALGAKKLGARTEAIWGATLGAIIGIFFGLPGLLLGPFIGAVAFQYVHDRDLVRAGKVGVGTWIGIAVGTAVKLALAFVMIGMYLLLRLV